MTTIEAVREVDGFGKDCCVCRHPITIHHGCQFHCFSDLIETEQFTLTNVRWVSQVICETCRVMPREKLVGLIPPPRPE